MALQEMCNVMRGAIQDDGDIVITRGPGIAQYPTAVLRIGRSKGVTEPVERRTQRRAPGLLPLRWPTRTTPAVAAPPLDTVRATPGCVLHDLDLVCGRILLQ